MKKREELFFNCCNDFSLHVLKKIFLNKMLRDGKFVITNSVPSKLEERKGGGSQTSFTSSLHRNPDSAQSSSIEPRPGTLS